MKYTFPKSQRLCSLREIDSLFQTGEALYCYPFRLLYHKIPSGESINHKIMISVPKKNFKSAVKRNLIKRRIREAYRLNHLTNLNSEIYLNIAFIYTEKKILNSHEISKNMVKALKKLGQII